MWKVLAVGNGQEMAATRPHSLTQFGFHQPMQGVLRVGPAFENRDNPDVKGRKGETYPEITADLRISGTNGMLRANLQGNSPQKTEISLKNREKSDVD